jgi:recombination protein RecR
MAIAIDRNGLAAELVKAIEGLTKEVCLCEKCGNITTVNVNPCAICTDSRRESGILCVVEEPGDVLIIERSGGYHGRYHVLMGRLSPMKGSSPSDLNMERLKERVIKEQIKEVILALSTDVEGDTTASYIIELLKDTNVLITRLAFGLPAGSAIMYSDSVTIAKAIQGRQKA